MAEDLMSAAYTQHELRKMRIKNRDRIPRKSITNMVGAVTTFERWLWSQPYHDNRTITKIPPAELDTYLAEFFKTVSKESGENYRYGTFASMRYHMERYLKEAGYPVSLMSPIFSKSCKAHQDRVARLSAEQHSTQSDLDSG